MKIVVSAVHLTISASRAQQITIVPFYGDICEQSPISSAGIYYGIWRHWVSIGKALASIWRESPCNKTELDPNFTKQWRYTCHIKRKYPLTLYKLKQISPTHFY